MRTPVRRVGNSAGVLIPKSMLEEIGVGPGDSLDMSLNEGRIVLVPLKRPARAGWAEASRELARTGGDSLVWPEFGNADDDALVW